jgi:hypothetical protein
MNYHCPSCNEIIHDHTRKFCGICGNALPGGLLLRITQADALHKEAAEAAERHKRNCGNTEAEEQKRSLGEALPS